MTKVAMKNSIQMDMVYHLDMWHECLAYGKHEEAEMHRAVLLNEKVTIQKVTRIKLKGKK